MPKKLLIILTGVVFTFVFFAGANGVKAATEGMDIPEVTEFVESVNSTEKGESGPNLAHLVYGNFEYIETSLLGVLTNAGLERADGSSKVGFIGGTTGLMAQMYGKPPATTETYIADLMDSANIASPAYAQGLGFASLTPILSAWKIFRNIAYFFFIIIFLTIGFLIMFRQKVGGQTAVTAQQAIPRVIVALLAVTFSYALAGLLIDIMYLFMYLLAGIFGESNELVQSSIFNVGIKVLTGWGETHGAASTTYFAVRDFATALTSGLDKGSSVVGFMAGLTSAVIVALAIAITVFRLFFELLKTYITIIISIAMAPLILMVGAVPGKNNFTKWFKGLVGNLSAFPIVLIILIIYQKLTDGIGTSGDGFMPPYLIGSGVGGALSVMIGLGFLMLSVDLVKEGKKTFGASGGIFDQFSGALAESVKRGWTGGQLVPGLGFTDTSKYGGSAKNILSKPFFGTEASRKAARSEDWGGWKGRLHRYTGAQGAMGSIRTLYGKRGTIKTQDDISEPQGRDVRTPEGVTPQTRRPKSRTVGIDS
ncbi:MAG: hypothetical protein ABFQ62_01980 [Patescibacteria group bacterium]